MCSSDLFADGLLYTGSQDSASLAQDANRLKMTVGLSTIYGNSVNIQLNSNVDDDPQGI